MWPNPQFPADLVTFTEEIFNGELHFLCSDNRSTLIEMKRRSSRAVRQDISNLFQGNQFWCWTQVTLIVLMKPNLTIEFYSRI